VSDELPEGIDRDTVLAHSLTMQILAQTINNAANFMRAEEGTPAEAEAEQILSDSVELVVSMGGNVVGDVILAFVSLLIDVAEPEAVQDWFNHQQEKIMEALEDAR
jgi:hypothetical protein